MDHYGINPSFGTSFASFVWYMKSNTPLSNKLALVSVAVCAVLVAFSQNASAAPAPLPIVPVPDGGTTVLLLGAALGALGVVRRYMKS